MILFICIIVSKEETDVKRRIFSLFMSLLMAFSAVLIYAPQAYAEVDENPDVADELTGEWIGAWGTAMTNVSLKDYDNTHLFGNNFAVRIVLNPTTSGRKLRLRLSNLYGKEDLVINGIFVHEGENGNKVKNSMPVSCDGDMTAVIPKGKEIFTDAIDFKVTAGSPIAVTMYLTGEIQDITTIGLSGAKTYIALNQEMPDLIMDRITSYLASSGIFPAALQSLINSELLQGEFYSFPLESKILSSIIPAASQLPEISLVPFLSGVDVFNEDEDAYSVVVVGDSLVSNSFPEYLGKAINAEGCTSVGVIGKGIFGNSLLSNGMGTMGNIYGPALLNRMKFDVLEQTGVKYAVVEIGVNDITHPESASIKEYYGGNTDYAQPTAQQMIDGYKKFITNCKKYGIKVILCTLTPWKGATRNYFGTDEYTWTSKDWQIAQDINEWIRTSKDIYGYFDLAELSASTKDSAKFNSSWTSDFLHPNDTAQQAWANEFPLDLIDIKTVPKRVSLNKETLTISAGKTYQLEETIYPETASLTDVKWKSSNSSVVTVTSDGTIKAVKNGTATITCTTVNGKTAKCKVTVQTPTTGVSLNTQSVSIYETQTYKLTATVKPSGASNKSVVWTSNNESVATVSKKGTVTGVKKGVAIITCTTKDTGKSESCVVTVKGRVKVKGISLNKSSKAVYKGSTYQLKATFTPSNASNQKIIWTSTDPDVAVVSSSGKVTAVKNGKATIYAITQDGNYTDVCKITVKTHAASVKLNAKSKTIYIGKTYTLKATVSPSTATNKNVKWKSSDKSVASVNSKGVVTAKKAGTATITCTTEDGSYKATCKIKVTKFYKVKSISLNKKSVSIEGGEKYQLKAKFNPTYASEQGTTWKSSNSRIVKVYSSGKIKGLKKGTATITCTSKSGKKTATCKVKVTSTPVSGVSLSKTKVTLTVTDTYRLKATIEPLDATYKGVTWKSSNKAVAKVSSSGKVTAVGAGTATITCITDDGDYTAKCKVTVKDIDDDFDIGGSSGSGSTGGDSFITVKLDRGTLGLSKGGKYTLKATVSPSSKKGAPLTWKSTNTAVAKVSSSGVVTAVGSGKCMIKCTVKDGSDSWTANCEVTVK